MTQDIHTYIHLKQNFCEILFILTTYNAFQSFLFRLALVQTNLFCSIPLEEMLVLIH